MEVGKQTVNVAMACREREEKMEKLLLYQGIEIFITRLLSLSDSLYDYMALIDNSSKEPAYFPTSLSMVR